MRVRIGNFVGTTHDNVVNAAVVGHIWLLDSILLLLRSRYSRYIS